MDQGTCLVVNVGVVLEVNHTEEAAEADWSEPDAVDEEDDNVDAPSFDAHAIQLNFPERGAGVYC